MSLPILTNPPRLVAGRRGFTLIELLIVVAIIALLLSILMPALHSARDSARRARCMANLHGIGVALMLYADDNKQQLPGYEIIGKHGFRIRPGNKLSMPIPGSSGMSPFPESWGLQAVLHTGTTPRILPSGVAIGTDTVKPMYFPFDSKAWLCPANPGPSDRTDWDEWGNGYAYRCNSGGGNPETLKRIYNIDYLGLSRARVNNPLVWDNFNLYPGDPGFNGPFDRYAVDRKFQQAPHKAAGHRGGPAQFWIAFYVGGHCEMNKFNR